MDASALPSAEYWLSWISIAKLFAAGFVALGVVMEFGSDWISGPFEATVKHVRELQVAALERDAAVARSEIATATASAASANAQVARVEQAARWRTVKDEQKASLVRALAGGPGGNVELSWAGTDPECGFLASQIEEVFKAANSHAGKPLWIVSFQPRVHSRGVFFGLRVLGSSPQAVSLREAFAHTGIALSEEMIPAAINDSPGIMIGGGQLPDPIIWVGPKRPF